jgi:methionyl aminopeptidase
MSNLVGLNKWNTWKNLPLNLDCYPSNKTYKHNTLDEIEPAIVCNDNITDMRKAAEGHRQVRRYIQNTLKIGERIEDVCERLENKTRELFKNINGHAGIGFPTGFSINNCVAHDSPIYGDNRIIQKNDIIKIDFGTHVNGYIIDSAFTVAWNEEYKPLIEATKEATWEGIKRAGVDMSVKEMSKYIKEIIESYEMTLNGKTYAIKAVGNLGGHDIYQYKIHGGALILSAPHDAVPSNMRMKENTCYAIETFATVGEGALGWTHHDSELSTTLYMLKNEMLDKTHSNIKLESTRKFLGYIKKTYKSLPFCTRWLEKDNISYKVPLSQLTKLGIVQDFPPLSENKGIQSSQLEHTIYLHEYGKEILSYGEDY